MKDVAREAGVHQTTVSLALRNHSGLPKSTCERIQKIARDLGYRTDPVLSALGAYRQSTKEQPTEQVIAWIINIEDPKRLSGYHVHKQLLEGAELRAKELGYKLETFWYRHDYKDSQVLSDTLKSRNIQGIILCALDAYEEPIELEWDNFSVIKISQVPHHLPFESILSNQIEAVEIAISELKRIGVKRIGVATSEFEERNNRFNFAAGYHAQHRQIAAEDYVAPFYFQHSANYKENVLPSVAEWARENKVEAILSNWNTINQVALQLTSEGQTCRFVPLDANEKTQALGGVNQDHCLTGHHAVEMTVGKIMTLRRGFETSPSTTLVTPILIPLNK